MPKYSFAPQRRRRNPIGLILLLILVLFVGFLVWLGVRSNEVPQQRIEQDVTNAVLAK
jgi:cytoskeletal protein RodZ